MKIIAASIIALVLLISAADAAKIIQVRPKPVRTDRGGPNLCALCYRPPTPPKPPPHLLNRWEKH